MKRSQWLLLVGMTAVSVTLRPAIASVAPILETIRTDLAISNAAASLLTTIPIVCMGVFAFTFMTITNHMKRSRLLLWGVVVIALSTTARVGSRNISVLFLSTLLVSISIGVTQAVLPALVTEHFPNRSSFVTGVYTASMTSGAIVATLLTAPLAKMFSWPMALAFWSVPAFFAVPIWLFVLEPDEHRTGSQPSDRGGFVRDGGSSIPWRRHSAWVLVAVFGGAIAMFFTVLTWLPPRYVALGWSQSAAGLLIAVCLSIQIGSNLFVSAVGDRWGDKRPLFGLMICSFVTGAAGVAILPLAAPFLWSVLLGIGSGGLFTLSLTLPITHAETPAETDKLTAMMLGVGYLIGSLGPVIGGVLRDLTGSDTLLFTTLTVFALSVLVPVFSLQGEETGNSTP